MSGKTNNQNDSLCSTFSDLFELQQVNQREMLASGLYDGYKTQGTTAIPVDDVRLMSYHIQQLISEIGEVLEADKRWKNVRNKKYCRANKLEEISDCFIVLMNIAMFSGFEGEELQQAIFDKINKVYRRMQSESFGI